MSSIFSKIVNNETPSFKVAEDENYLAFLDAFPLSYGHVLVIPKKETDYIFDLDSDKYLGLWNFSQKVAKAMDKVIVCKRIGVAVIGLEVPHAHIHLVPINGISDINFEREKKTFSADKMQEIADKINFALS
ncbi:MAG: HIT family protein [Flavobacteriales bacterium]|nr:HIT family protein [Flavobacteriales bacterium]MBT4738434.1 HIT family protein [Flavobacteriales bacterium]MBT6699931.1 HIT family protein [Flavobacteriales bacterium]MBT6816060.1 HIT family protein [Flavobacteriales bacterium]MBT7619684.1 HIT family protein [Flavobacteriales bacterium]